MADWLRMCANVINEYCLAEFDHEADFSDVSNIGLAYTTIDENNEVFIQVSVDFVQRRVVRWQDGPEGRTLTFYHEFEYLAQLYNWLCGNLDFEWLAFDLEGHWYTNEHDEVIKLR